MDLWCNAFKEQLKTDKLIVYVGDNIEFLKIKLEEKLIEELIDKEINK